MYNEVLGNRFWGRFVKVCILTAGIGERMGSFTSKTNKVLLPYQNKAIISHIIEQFPAECEFVIALGHQGHHIQQYLRLAHPLINFNFINIKNYNQPGSGPGQSLLQCQKELSEPFYAVCGDTLWNPSLENIQPTSFNWLGVSPLTDDEKTSSYCTVTLDKHSFIHQIYEKSKESPTRLAFNGLLFINDHKSFFQNLASKPKEGSEHQLSQGFLPFLDKKDLKANQMKSWLDLGQQRKYIAANKSCPQFAFRKENEHFYEVNHRIIKYFSDKKLSCDRVKRQKFLSRVTPEIMDFTDHFYCYQKVPGEVFYDKATPALFSHLLHWLNKNLWQTPLKNEVIDFKAHCLNFYKKKTNRRVYLFHKKYPHKNLQRLLAVLDTINWSWLSEGIACPFHGDLQFDNIIAQENTFTLIDWRQDFDGLLYVGDIYYDLAKLKLGLDIDLRRLKMSAHLQQNISPASPQINDPQKYQAILKQFCQDNNLSYKKVSLISYLNLINMAPLHSEKLALYFWNLGLHQLEAFLNTQGPCKTISP